MIYTKKLTSTSKNFKNKISFFSNFTETLLTMRKSCWMQSIMILSIEKASIAPVLHKQAPQLENHTKTYSSNFGSKICQDFNQILF